MGETEKAPEEMEGQNISQKKKMKWGKDQKHCESGSGERREREYRGERLGWGMFCGKREYEGEGRERPD